MSEILDQFPSIEKYAPPLDLKSLVIVIAVICLLQILCCGGCCIKMLSCTTCCTCFACLALLLSSTLILLMLLWFYPEDERTIVQIYIWCVALVFGLQAVLLCFLVCCGGCCYDWISILMWVICALGLLFFFASFALLLALLGFFSKHQETIITGWVWYALVFAGIQLTVLALICISSAMEPHFPSVLSAFVGIIWYLFMFYCILIVNTYRKTLRKTAPNTELSRVVLVNHK